MGQHSNLYNGYTNLKSYRGTLTGGAVTTIDAHDDFPNGAPPAAVLIYPPSTGSLYVVLSAEKDAASVTNPTEDGTSDTNDEMIEVASGDGPFSADFAANTLKLIHTSAEDYRVVVMG